MLTRSLIPETRAPRFRVPRFRNLRDPRLTERPANIRIPFDISLMRPNEDTVLAMLEAERIARDPSVKGYTDLDELFADLKK